MYSYINVEERIPQDQKYCFRKSFPGNGWALAFRGRTAANHDGRSTRDRDAVMVGNSILRVISTEGSPLS
jgi:hypothetical protein